MPDPAERIVNLALFLAAARTPVSAERIRTEVIGYPVDQDEAAFLRMFERDKEDLRTAGLVVTATSDGDYSLDLARSFCTEFPLTSAEEIGIRAASSALLEDPSFPFVDDLRRALLKIAAATDSPLPVAARVADERPAEQGATAALLATASADRKSVTFQYTNAAGRSAAHALEPYGLFVREGRWYLVGRDVDLDDVRVYAVARMLNTSVNPSRPKTPDFEMPDGFDVRSFIGLPFQYGPGDPFEATVRFDQASAWRAPVLTGGAGSLERDGSDVLWRVTARDSHALLRWVISHGPGVEVVAPDALATVRRDGLARVVADHG